jgi:2-polyprenyl-3-methyl-5-hydroxy-6-metoxy-1,4-benzoquinol methylase
MTKTNKISCDLCGSNEHKFLFEAKDRLHGFDGTFSYVICNHCGLVFMNPQVSPSEIVKFYPPDYAPHKAKVDTKQPDQSAIKNKLKRRPFAASCCKRLSEKSRVLDVGCGNGNFLYEINTVTGCQAYGIDISKIAAKTAQENYGIDVFTGTILESPFPDNFFDVITAWAFLEHVNNPSEVLLKMSNLLKKDGLCIISIANFESLNAKLFKDKWYHLGCPRHLYIFTMRTITGLFEKSNFTVKKITYNKSSNGILGSLQYCIYGDNYSPNHSNKVKRSLLLRKIVSPWSRITALARQSDMISVCAEKTKN